MRTEIIAFSDRAREFEELNAQLIAASTDTPEVGRLALGTYMPLTHHTRLGSGAICLAVASTGIVRLSG